MNAGPLLIGAVLIATAFLWWWGFMILAAVWAVFVFAAEG